jgi:hypothetical protein
MGTDFNIEYNFKENGKIHIIDPVDTQYVKDFLREKIFPLYNSSSNPCNFVCHSIDDLKQLAQQKMGNVDIFDLMHSKYQEEFEIRTFIKIISDIIYEIKQKKQDCVYIRVSYCT